LPVTITSNDSSRLLLSAIPVGGTTCTDAGTASISVVTKSVQPQPGVIVYIIPSFCVYGIGNSGSASYSVSVPGYALSTGSVTLAPSGFVIAGPGGIGDPNFSPQSATTPITVSSALLDSGLNFVSVQPLAIGQSANVTVSDSNPAAGTVNPTTLTITGGSSSNTTTFTKGSGGSTTLSVNTPAGFSTPATILGSAPAPTGVIATVLQPGLSLSCKTVTIGQNLEASCTVTISATPSAVSVTLTSNNPSLVLLSTTATSAGSASISVTIPANVTSATYYAQALMGSGTATHTATSPGFTTATATTTLAPSGVVISGPFGFGQNFPAPVSGGPVPVTVYMAVLNTNAATCPLSSGAPCFLGIQALRGGAPSVPVTLNSSSTGVGTIASPVTILAGSDHVVSQFTPVSPGSTTVSVITPAGFTTSTNNTLLPASVTP
jgi:hypothetical protein